MVLFLCLSNSFSYETIETQLIPLGISGIEDLLQDNVFETIDVEIIFLILIIIVFTKVWYKYLDDYW